MAAPTEGKETEHPAEALAEEHPFVKTPTQLLTLVFLSFTVPVVILIMLAILATEAAFGPEHPAMTEQAIAARIKPVGEVTIAEGPSPLLAPPAAPAAAAAAAPAAPAIPSVPPPTAAVPAVPPPTAAAPAPAGPAPAAVAAADGKAVYEKYCAVCHVAGVAGAPKFGDKTAWGPRLAQSIEALHQTVLKGKGAMPPRGGAAQLTDAEILAAVKYMVDAAK